MFKFMLDLFVSSSQKKEVASLKKATWDNRSAFFAAGGGVCLHCQARVSRGEAEYVLEAGSACSILCPNCNSALLVPGEPDEKLLKLTRLYLKVEGVRSDSV